jgi:hypothetical protein
MPVRGPLLGLLLVLAAATAPSAGAATRCESPALLVRWPEERPVWELCWRRPRDSSGPAGSGLELTGVRYRGRPVLERAHAPAVWAEHVWAEHAAAGDPECAGRCLRARMSEESPFAAGAEVVPGWHEPDPAPPAGAAAPAVRLWPLRTACGRPAGAAPGDCPWGEALACASGVAIERSEERLTLTTQLADGRFRYVMSWTFHRDGTLEPRFGFARGSDACAETPVLEHVVWRLDFDLGARDRLLPAEDGAGWRVTDVAAGRGFLVVPGAGDLDPALHPSAGDPDQLAGLAGGCAFDPGALRPWIPPADPEPGGAARADGAVPPGGSGDGAPAAAGPNGAGGGARGTDRRPPDLVLWYHAAAEGTAAGCRLVGPTLTPFGAWPRLGEPLFEDGFESGGLGAWTAQRP